MRQRIFIRGPSVGPSVQILGLSNDEMNEINTMSDDETVTFHNALLGHRTGCYPSPVELNLFAFKFAYE